MTDNILGRIILAMTFALILAFVGVLAFLPGVSQAADSAITLGLGMLIKGWMTALDYEFGSSRSSKEKDATIASMSDSSNKVATVALEAKTGATS